MKAKVHGWRRFIEVIEKMVSRIDYIFDRSKGLAMGFTKRYRKADK